VKLAGKFVALDPSKSDAFTMVTHQGLVLVAWSNEVVPPRKKRKLEQMNEFVFPTGAEAEELVKFRSVDPGVPAKAFVAITTV
jgi:hypothetical protein